MQRALDLAQKGIGNVSPNPLVGCVIVLDGKIIGEGWHQKYGEAHAEVNAINYVIDKSLLSKSTLYVTLEPCAHFGKTPPCANLIVEHNIPNVVVCNKDPFEKVAGKGIKILENAGIKVITGVLEEKGKWLNRRFFSFIKDKRPYVVLKWAQTSDGFVARTNFDSKWISNAISRKIVHKFRAEEDAILVGFNTALHDNPKLDCREWKGKNPLRIVLDKKLELPTSLHLFDRTIPTICFNKIKNEQHSNLEFVKIDFENIEEAILDFLYERNIQSLFVEGGGKTLQGFIEKDLWNQANIFISKTQFEEGIKAPKLSFKNAKTIQIKGDVMVEIVR